MAIQTLTLGGGCFWCVEAIYQNLKGVISVVSGYAGGSAEQANYRDVCSGTTGHAEVIRIEYDDSEITIETLLDVFFHLHDPTTQRHTISIRYILSFPRTKNICRAGDSSNRIGKIVA